MSNSEEIKTSFTQNITFRAGTVIKHAIQVNCLRLHYNPYHRIIDNVKQALMFNNQFPGFKINTSKMPVQLVQIITDRHILQLAYLSSADQETRLATNIQMVQKRILTCPKFDVSNIQQELRTCGNTGAFTLV